MMIFVTWTEVRGWVREYGKPVAALWIAEGTHKDLAKAKAHAAKIDNVNWGMKVYATETTDYATAKAEALAAHK